MLNNYGTYFILIKHGWEIVSKNAIMFLNWGIFELVESVWLPV